MIILGIILWFVVGCSGYIYWWTKYDNLETTDLLLVFMFGVLGLFTWVILCLVDCLKGNGKILIKRRVK